MERSIIRFRWLYLYLICFVAYRRSSLLTYIDAPKDVTNGKILSWETKETELNWNHSFLLPFYGKNIWKNTSIFQISADKFSVRWLIDQSALALPQCPCFFHQSADTCSTKRTAASLIPSAHGLFASVPLLHGATNAYSALRLCAAEGQEVSWVEMQKPSVRAGRPSDTVGWIPAVLFVLWALCRCLMRKKTTPPTRWETHHLKVATTRQFGVTLSAKYISMCPDIEESSFGLATLQTPACSLLLSPPDQMSQDHQHQLVFLAFSLAV